MRTTVLLFTEDVNRELNCLEGDLKKIFPNDPDRVASYLSATRPVRPAPEEAPANPPVTTATIASAIPAAK